MSSIETSRTVASLPANHRLVGSHRPIARVSQARRRNASAHEPFSRGAADGTPGSSAPCPESIANHMKPYGDRLNEYGRSVTGEKRF